MRLSRLIGERYREKPADASLISHQYLLKGGYMRPVSNGSYTLLTPAQRIVHKIEEIIRREMNRLDGQEVLFPIVLPRELWEESGRYQSVGKELLRFSDRTDADFVLAMTHEEAAVHLAKSEARSYSKYPFMIYQIQTKFRDEPRARGGLIRVKEFTMKDAYSFHTTQEDLDQYYTRCLAAYHNIFEQVGLKDVLSIGSDTGMMGGSVAHEFMYISDAGEDHIIQCDRCDYKANMEVAEAVLDHPARPDQPIKEVSTPGMKSIKDIASFFHIQECQTIKAAFFQTEDTHRAVIVFLRGDLEVNEAKLRKILGEQIEPLQNPAAFGITAGFCGPVNLQTSGDVILYYDSSLQNEHDLVCGANQIDRHLTGVTVGRDISPTSFHDIAKAKGGQTCPKCGGKLQERRGIEVGNIFQLGVKYTKSMNMTYIDPSGNAQHPLMGCYGIGIGRLLACIIEQHNDAFGPIWPYAVAPWQIHICCLSNKKIDTSPYAEKLYAALSERYEVLLDDRNVSAGVAFADADLLGVPIRLIVSARNIEQNQVELVTRDKTIQKAVPIEDVPKAVDELAASLTQ